MAFTLQTLSLANLGFDEHMIATKRAAMHRPTVDGVQVPNLTASTGPPPPLGGTDDDVAEWLEAAPYVASGWHQAIDPAEIKANHGRFEFRFGLTDPELITAAQKLHSVGAGHFKVKTTDAKYGGCYNQHEESRHLIAHIDTKTVNVQVLTATADKTLHRTADGAPEMTTGGVSDIDKGCRVYANLVFSGSMKSKAAGKMTLRFNVESILVFPAVMSPTDEEMGALLEARAEERAGRQSTFMHALKGLSAPAPAAAGAAGAKRRKIVPDGN